MGSLHLFLCFFFFTVILSAQFSQQRLQPSSTLGHVHLEQLATSTSTSGRRNTSHKGKPSSLSHLPSRTADDRLHKNLRPPVCLSPTNLGTRRLFYNFCYLACGANRSHDALRVHSGQQGKEHVTVT